MDLVTLPLRLPFLPVQSLIRLAEVLADEAERELHDPARVRRELEDAQQRHAAGEISDAELAEIEEEATASLITRPSLASAPAPGAADGARGLTEDG
jgi:hypothetical protein